MATPARRLRIDFLYLDLDTCTRCRATDAALIRALELTGPALEAAGIGVTVTRALVAGEEQARALGFASSPTIRVDGVDVAGQLLESPCDTCSEACACDGSVDCRDWAWRDERTTEPPAGLIVEAIMARAFGAAAGAAPETPPAPVEVPANLSRFFASKAGKPAPAGGPCCGPAAPGGRSGPRERAVCCGPEDQAGCCRPEELAGWSVPEVLAACCGPEEQAAGRGPEDRAGCCGPEEQAGCCGPEEKEGCCGPVGATAASGSACGCR